MAGSSHPSGRALVLAGGGALGAYEAGVVHYLLDGLPRERKLRRPPRFDLFTGTSVGALNASFLAPGAQDPARAARDLVSMWRSVTFDKVLRFRSGELSALYTLLMGTTPGPALWKRHKPRPEAAPHPPVAGLFDSDFAAELNAILGQRRNASYRPIQTCHIRPSEDLNLLAMRALSDAPDEVQLPGLPGRVISRLLRSGALAESGLLSMLMFTPTFVHSLLDLGYRDARARQDDLVDLFAD